MLVIIQFILINYAGSKDSDNDSDGNGDENGDSDENNDGEDDNGEEEDIDGGDDEQNGNNDEEDNDENNSDYNDWCNAEKYGKDHTMCIYDAGAQSSCGSVTTPGITTQVKFNKDHLKKFESY